MTRLRKMMLEELQRRNFSEDTIRHYIRTVEDFARHFSRPPDRLGLRHIREYQAHLFQTRKLSSGTVTNRLAALRFFYIQTLKKAWSVAETPYPKKNHLLPAILSQEEVAGLIDAADTPFHRTLLMTLYATGLRRAEVTHLKVSDIDSKCMVIHVRGGKGRKDRDVMLSPKLLEELSCASAILVSWPIGDVPLSCRYAFTCLARHKNRWRIKLPLARSVSGVAPSVVDRWWSSKGLPPQKSNFVLHRCSLLSHETLLPNPNPSRLSACSVSLRLNAEQNSILTSSARPPRYSLPLVRSRCLLPCSPHSLRHTPHRCLLPFNLHKARVRRTHKRLPSSGLIERARSYIPSFTALPKRASD
jgi:hypothetical protein